jgi:glycosyltransferase involved in cell wall biosynthesis
MLFSNSWHQGPSSFYIRGGLDVLEAFDRVAPKFPHARLTLRTSLPADIAPRYLRIIHRRDVRVLDGFLADAEWTALREASHVYLLPSDRIHIVSILQAMAYGMAVIASDGWGMREYVDHLRNGWVTPGRYGKITWCEEETGTLREDYAPMRWSDPAVVDALTEAMTRVIEDEALRDRLGQTARADIETRYSLENWNRGLQRVFDRCLPPEELP